MKQNTFNFVCIMAEITFDLVWNPFTQQYLLKKKKVSWVLTAYT